MLQTRRLSAALGCLSLLLAVAAPCPPPAEAADAGAHLERFEIHALCGEAASETLRLPCPCGCDDQASGSTQANLGAAIPAPSPRLAPPLFSPAAVPDLAARAPERHPDLDHVPLLG